MTTNSEKQKTAVVLGGNGFIGHHMARRLKSEGYFVRVVDIKDYEYGPNDYSDEVKKMDLRNLENVHRALYGQYAGNPDLTMGFDEIYCYACNMGGAGWVFTGNNDAEIMHDSAIINLNICNVLARNKFKGKIFYSSSACMYPQEIQEEPNHKGLKESDAYPANPDSEYGWEKVFSERLFQAFARNHGFDVRIARFHNIFGPEGTWKGGKEKAPAATIRKVLEATTEVEVWGTGEQTRSFLYIDDCTDAVRLLMQSDCNVPLNIGSSTDVSINVLTDMAMLIAEKFELKIKYVEGPIGVMGRNSDNTLIKQELGWEPKITLRKGMELTHEWIKKQIEKDGAVL